MWEKAVKGTLQDCWREGEAALSLPADDGEVGKWEATDRTRSHQSECSLNQTCWYNKDLTIYNIKPLIKFTVGLQEK